MHKQKQSKSAKSVIPVRLDADLLEQVDTLAGSYGEPRTTIMRMAIRVGLKFLKLPGAADEEAIYPPPIAQADKAADAEIPSTAEEDKGRKKATGR